MAKETLSTSYKNDIMNSSMGEKRRWKLIDNGDGTVSLEDATKYEQKGTDFTATDLNKITKAVNASADAGKIIDDKDSILATTAKGYMAGALGVKNLLNELNSNLNKGELSLLKSVANTVSVTVEASGDILVMYTACRSSKAVSSFGITSSSGEVEIFSNVTCSGTVYSHVLLAKITNVSNPTITFNGGGRDSFGCSIFSLE